MEKEDNYGVPNDDIIGGIRAAISRGETLKQAMVTLFNAGYSKEEIEDAARRYMLGKSEESIYASTAPKKKNDKKEGDEVKEETGMTPGGPGGPEPTNLSRSPGQKPGLSRKEEKQKEKELKKEDKELKKEEAKKKINSLTTSKKVDQKVSAYDSNKKPNKKRKVETTTIILIILLLLLIGVLVTVFMFKAELVEFFNNLFG